MVNLKSDVGALPPHPQSTEENQNKSSLRSYKDEEWDYAVMYRFLKDIRLLIKHLGEEIACTDEASESFDIRAIGKLAIISRKIDELIDMWIE